MVAFEPKNLLKISTLAACLTRVNGVAEFCSSRMFPPQNHHCVYWGRCILGRQMFGRIIVFNGPAWLATFSRKCLYGQHCNIMCHFTSDNYSGCRSISKNFLRSQLEGSLKISSHNTQISACSLLHVASFTPNNSLFSRITYFEEPILKLTPLNAL